eukprot:gene12780-12909_t
MVMEEQLSTLLWSLPGTGSNTSAGSHLVKPGAELTPVLSTGRDHVLLYAFSYTDPEFLHNLEYFVQEAVEGDTLADHIIIVQEGPTLKRVPLPELPPHARYVSHHNECYDWGTYGWLLLRSGLVNMEQYRYFFFINSSVRGPYLPAYAKGHVHWMSAFTSKLTDTVKLVGSTISCEGSPLHGHQRGRWRRNPHVQSYAVATDAVGLHLLIGDQHVFACHKDRWDTIYYSELGSSKCILDAGYNIDSLMLRYQGVDWRDRDNWDCNAKLTPTSEFGCDGVSVDPLEVMFVKLKSYMITSEISFSKKALKYQHWQQQSASWPGSFNATSSNEYLDELYKFKTPRVLESRARGSACFDFDFYLKQNPDLKPLWGKPLAIWRHFVYYGQFDARPHKFICDLDYKKLTAWPGLDK